MVEIIYKLVKESFNTCFPDRPIKGGYILGTSMTPPYQLWYSLNRKIPGIISRLQRQCNSNEI